MSISKFNNIFHNSGIQGILELLYSKLEANDLSLSEALALLSAVHEELGHGSLVDSKVYQSYSTFMRFLQQKNPDTYNYVVSSWNRRLESDLTGEDDSVANADESRMTDTISQNSIAKQEKGFDEVKDTIGDLNEADEAQESEEIEGRETNLVELIKKGGYEQAQEVTDEGAEEDVNDQKDDKSGEPEESDDNKQDESVDEPEIIEAKEGESEEVEEDTELDEKETEPDENTMPGEVHDGSETGKSEPDGEAGIEPKENEWPEVEQSQPDELFDGLEEENDPPQGED